MASAIFVVPIESSSPALSVGTDAESQCSGFSCIGQTPTAETCLVRVYGTAAQLDALAADPDMLLVEVVENA